MDEKKEKILKLVLGTITLVIAVVLDKIFELPIIWQLGMYLVPYLIVGFEVIKEAIEGIKEKEIFNECFLMAIATIGAMLIGFLPNGSPEFIEAVFVMLFFNLGELFEIIAEEKSRKSIKSLLEIRPDYANVIRKDDEIKVNPEEIEVGEIIAVNPGEKVPLDGIVVEGETFLNTVAITGESLPKFVDDEDVVLSGCININGRILLKVTKDFYNSTATKIIEMVEDANENKSNVDKFITKFARIYTPIVVLGAILLAVVPTILFGNLSTWLFRALSFLIISCPCALVISIPLSYFGGIGYAAKLGILIKGANYLEQLSKTKVVALDKTGTLTEGVFEVTAIHPNKFNEKELLHLAAHAEKHSSHPIATSLKNAYAKIDNLEDKCKISEVEELAGLGIKAKVNEDYIYVGNTKLMESININPDNCNKVGTIIHVAKNDEYLGHIVISDKIKEDSRKAIQLFNKEKIDTVMLTGDTEQIAKNVSEDLGITKYYAQLLPEDKVKIVKELIDKKAKDTNVIFIGDGINDAPVIANADLGVAMGVIGSDVAIETADIVLMEDNISKLYTGIHISRKTQKIAKENIFISIFVKILVLILAVLGYAPMWLAIFADVGVTLIAILNAMRTMK